MLAKRTRAQVFNVTSPCIGKVVGLSDLALRPCPIERSVLDLRAIPNGSASSELSSLPWLAFLAGHSDSCIGALRDRPVVSDLEEAAVVAEGDVIRFSGAARYVDVLYRRGANSNALFVTERCNNFCTMCSQPPREVNDSWRLDELFALVPLIDNNDRWLGITGGEPTLLGDALFRLIRFCGEQLPSTGIHVLSNGRRFADRAYAASTRGLHPDLSWAIPVYGDVAHVHDYVVQREGAFAETVRGLYHLAAANQQIEIRVVLVKPTVTRLVSLARFIARSFPFARHVALMGIEAQGFARANYADVWIDPADYSHALQDATATLHNPGLQTSIYNLPLCALPRTLWPFARQSISDWKNTYFPACSKCKVREQCCGVFASTSKEWVSRAISPIREVEVFQ